MTCFERFGFGVVAPTLMVGQHRANDCRTQAQIAVHDLAQLIFEEDLIEGPQPMGKHKRFGLFPIHGTVPGAQVGEEVGFSRFLGIDGHHQRQQFQRG